MRLGIRALIVVTIISAVVFGNQAVNVLAATPSLSTNHFTASTTGIGTFGYRSMANIDGNYIVWTDNRGGSEDVYLYNITTSTETGIASNPSNEFWPDVSGDRIIYVDDVSGYDEIMYYTISTGMTQQITSYTDGEARQPSISGDRAVWMDDRNGDWDIYMYDFSTSITSQLTTSSTDQESPVIDGDIVAYENYDALGDADIEVLDLSTMTYTQVTTDSYDQYWPEVSGSRVVWMDDRHGGYNAYEYDLSTGVEKRLTTGLGDAYFPVIDGDLVIWSDDRGGVNQLYMYDLADDSEYQLTASSNAQYGPRIDGVNVAWADDDGLSGGYTGYYGAITYTDTAAPVFDNLPNTKEPSNITQGMSITTSPTVIRVKPTDDIGVVTTRFYADDNLICTVNSGDAEGVYSCSWTVNTCAAQIKVEAVDAVGNITTLTRDIVVNTGICGLVLPVTGANR